VNKDIIIALCLFTAGQLIIWYQTNAQFLSEWAKDRPWLLAIIGWPVSYILIVATTYAVKGFDGLLWPGRLVGFSTGMIIMASLTYVHLGEGINLKTGITLLLSFIIVVVQVFWK